MAAGGVLLVLGMAVLPAISNAQMSTTTLGTSIDDVNTAAYAYVGVLISHYWGFALGFLVLIGVIALGKRFVTSLF